MKGTRWGRKKSGSGLTEAPMEEEHGRNDVRRKAVPPRPRSSERADSGYGIGS